MSTKTLLTLFLFMVISQNASAIEKSFFYHNGNQLLKYCESNNPTERVSCMAYLAGTIDTTEAWVVSNKMKRTICKPPEVTARQLKKIFINYANKNPKSLHLAASGISIAAFVDAFPCN